MTVFCALSLNEKLKRLLRDRLGDVSINFIDQLEKGERLPAFLRSEVCFGNVSSSWLEQSAQLRWVQLESAGFGEYQQVGENKNFVVTNMGDFFGVPVAESALAGILALFRGINALANLQRDKKWVGGALRPQLRNLTGAKVLILGGSGSIGSHLHQLLKGFDAEVTTFGRRPSKSDVTRAADLDEVIPSVDVVVCCLPETSETINLMDRRRLQLMSSRAIFVNVGRGSVVDEPALISLLQEGRIAGSVLDVTEKEPLPADSPLWTCPNTILTQHTGGGFEEETLGKVELFLENFERFQKGQKLLNEVELERGY